MLRSQTTKDQYGNTWRVGRKLLPWNIRLRKMSRGKSEAAETGLDILSWEAIEGFGGWGIALVVLGAVLFLIFPVLILALEIVLALVILLTIVIGGFVLRRPWIIYARKIRPKKTGEGSSIVPTKDEDQNPTTQPEEGVTFGIRGWGRSKRALLDLKAAIEQGIPQNELESYVKVRSEG